MALLFISGNPRINLGSLANLSESTAMTIAGWVKLASTSGDATIAIRGVVFGIDAPWIFWRDDVASLSGRTNTLAALVNTNAGLLRIEAADNLLNDTEWRHVALVFEAGASEGLRLYVDGVRDANVQSTVGHTKLVADTTDVTLGVNATPQVFAGEMAELAIWRAALADNHIAQLAQGFSPLALPHYWSDLQSYQSLLRGLNHPGIGPAATSTGVLSDAPHPRTMRPSNASLTTSSIRSLLAGPYRSASGETNSSNAAAADTFIPGVDQGALTTAGEVHS